jgi:hypothetical protein
MLLEIGLGQADEATFRSLHEWIKEERIESAQVETKTGSAPLGRMGLDIGTVLSVILAAPAVKALVGCLQAWITQRRPKADIVIKPSKAGLSVVIHTENMPKPELLLDHVVPLLQAAAEQSP